MNNITLKAECELIDNGARDFLTQLSTKVDTLNERTKIHTIDIKNLRKATKKLKEEITKSRRKKQ